MAEELGRKIERLSNGNSVSVYRLADGNFRLQFEARRGWCKFAATQIMLSPDSMAGLAACMIALAADVEREEADHE